MAINRTIEIEWDGKLYECKVTMGLIDRVEEELNILKMLNNLKQGDIRFSHAAKLIAFILRDAGAEVTQEDVFEGLFHGDEALSFKEVCSVVNEIMMAFFPEPPKKPQAKSAKQKSKRKASTRGKTTTK